MEVKLTKEQMQVLKGMVEICGRFADQLLHIMKNHGLDKIHGCDLNINVCPKNLFTTESVRFGVHDTDAGYIYLTKGRRMLNEKFVPTGTNSAEYECLFAEPAVAERIRKILEEAEHPLPPDGLWVSANHYSDPVDGWEWDINDSLS